MFRQCGDGQAGIDAQVGGEHRAVTDQHVAVMEDAILAIADAVLGGGRHGRTAHAVRRGGDVEEYLGDAAAGDGADGLCATRDEVIRLGDEGRDALALGDQRLAQRPVPQAFQCHVEMAIRRLHAQKDDRLLREAPRQLKFQRAARIGRHHLRHGLEPREGPCPAGLAPGHRGEQQPHEIGARRIARGFDMGVLIDMNAGADGDALGHVIGTVRHATADQRLRIGAYPLAQRVRDVRQ